MMSFRSKSPDATADRISITTASQTRLLIELETLMMARQGFALATVNLDHLAKLRHDTAFRAAYARQTHVVADGNPVVWLQRLAGQPVELVPGSELILPLAALAAQHGITVAFLGGRAETLDIAAKRLEAACPGLHVVAKIAPPYGFDPQGAQALTSLQTVAASGAGLCFLALGAPKQEILAARARGLLPGVGFASIGAGLDFIAGTQTRAPLWVRRLALEWLWRMALNPRRLARRYLDCALILPGLIRAALRARHSTD